APPARGRGDQRGGRRPLARARMDVALVFTERRADLTASRAANFGRLKASLEEAGARVTASWYEEGDLGDAGAVVLSGSSAPWSAHDPAQLARLGDAVAGRPVLGVCAGMQLLARFAGGELGAAATPERGLLPVDLLDRADLFRGLQERIVVFHDHTDEVKRL